MKDEIVIQWSSRVSYDRSFRVAGAKLVQVGVGSTEEWELEAAINEKTAAVAFVFASPQGGAVPLPKVVEIAHRHDVPVIVDAAAMLPPVENLTRYVDMGADMVSFSGGKGVLGPQSTGILCGRDDLIRAAWANSSPNSHAVGRAAKVCKEEVAGLITALELFVDTDHHAVFAEWRARCVHIVEALNGIPGVRAELAEATPELDEFESATPRTFVHVDNAPSGLGRQQVVDRLANGDPPIRVIGESARGIAISPVNLLDGEAEVIGARLRELLTSG
jgi:L-seryl-tRNA(Ser) seleniumtransferase